MGTIKIQQKIDEFKIRLKILELKRQTIVNTDELEEIREEIKEVEKEFREFCVISLWLNKGEKQ